MESSIAVFLFWWFACELPPTCNLATANIVDHIQFLAFSGFWTAFRHKQRPVFQWPTLSFRCMLDTNSASKGCELGAAQ